MFDVLLCGLSYFCPRPSLTSSEGTLFSFRPVPNKNSSKETPPLTDTVGVPMSECVFWTPVPEVLGHLSNDPLVSVFRFPIVDVSSFGVFPSGFDVCADWSIGCGLHVSVRRVGRVFSTCLQRRRRCVLSVSI